jgi:hypothetical protein
MASSGPREGPHRERRRWDPGRAGAGPFPVPGSCSPAGLFLDVVPNSYNATQPNALQRCGSPSIATAFSALIPAVAGSNPARRIERVLQTRQRRFTLDAGCLLFPDLFPSGPCRAPSGVCATIVSGGARTTLSKQVLSRLVTSLECRGEGVVGCSAILEAAVGSPYRPPSAMQELRARGAPSPATAGAVLGGMVGREVEDRNGCGGTWLASRTGSGSLDAGLRAEVVSALRRRCWRAIEPRARHVGRDLRRPCTLRATRRRGFDHGARRSKEPRLGQR